MLILIIFLILMYLARNQRYSQRNKYSLKYNLLREIQISQNFKYGMQWQSVLALKYFNSLLQDFYFLKKHMKFIY